MNYDKYPPLPKAPDFPTWKDTPEREALHLELEKKKFDLFSKNGCLSYLISYVIAVIIANYTFFRGADWLVVAFMGFLISGYVLILWTVVFNCIGLRINYGIWFFSLQRPNIMADVAQVLENRPDFEEELFCSYWRDEEHAQMALKVINLVHETWDFPNKMIYPNDSLMLLYEHLFLPDVDPEPDNYWERICDETNINEDENNYKLLYDYDISFAEFVETCVGNNKNRES